MLLGIDIGTSGTKTVLFTDSGNPVTSASAEYPLYQPKNGWAEQEPEDWWNACRQTISAVLSQSGIDPAEIHGVGLSGQMHGLVMLDGDGKVLRRSIIWCDCRTEEECEEITSAVGYDRLIAVTCNPALTGFTASKLLWVRNHEPEIYDKCRKILLPKDYIRYRLTGEYATEVSDASGMQLLDVPNRCWSDEILTKLKIDPSLLGTVYESCEITGQVTPQASARTGLKAGTAVVGGAGDQAAAGVGNGIVLPGKMSVTVGTSGVVFAYTDRPVMDKKGRIQTFCHAVPGKWHVMGVTQAAGLSLHWLRDTVCTEEKAQAEREGVDSYDILNRLAEKSGVGAGGLVYLPYLMGERTPHLDPQARGVFFGLSALHNRGDMVRAVMEGVTFSLRDCISVIRESGIDAESVIASGGGGKSSLWRQMIADNFGCPVSTLTTTEGGAWGVALLAGVGTGVYSTVQEGCAASLKQKTSVSPDAAVTLLYDRRYELYGTLYRQLKDCFRQL